MEQEFNQRLVLPPHLRPRRLEWSQARSRRVLLEPQLLNKEPYLFWLRPSPVGWVARQLSQTWPR